ncbi:hypothetical protein TNCV_2894311 [Trichonephila clavipes]|nr:hypothetical protein TNCV_2894311 [Trichonephila clavipes]
MYYYGDMNCFLFRKDNLVAITFSKKNDFWHSCPRLAQFGLAISKRPSKTFSSNICGRTSAITRRICLSDEAHGSSATWLIRNRPMTLHSPTENMSSGVKSQDLEANSEVQNVKLWAGHPTCLSINRLWHVNGAV